MLHSRSGGQLVLEAGERGRGAPRPRRVHDVVAEEPHGERPPPRRSTPPAACRVSMWKNTASPGSSAQPTIGAVARSISGSSSRLPSGNQRAWSSMNERGISQGPRCDPATNSSVASAARDRPASTCCRSGCRRRCSRADPGATAWAGRVPGLLDQQVVVVQPHALRSPSARPRWRRRRESRMKRSYSPIRSQLQKSSKKRPASSSRLATIPRGLGPARLRSMPSADEPDLAAENAPRTQTAPSRR